MNEQATHPAPGDDDVPIEIPEYELVRPIGEGGFGQVWLARNRTTGRLRAVKLVPLGRSDGTDRAGREIMSLTRLEANLRHHHASLLTIHHVGKTADYLYYVMDLADDVSGSPAGDGSAYRPASLESMLENGSLSAEDCSRWSRQLLEGLASLHRAGMVHRDVKPSNCLLVDGELKLADFGLVTDVGPQISRIGTRKYMPPDGRMDTRADVYAAGLVIHEMITGLPAETFPRLGERAGEVARTPVLCTLVRLTLGACQPDPRQRFQDAPAMLAELDSDPQRLPNRTRRRRRTISCVCGLAAAIALAAALLWPTSPDLVQVNFITDEPLFEATIHLDGRELVRPDGTPFTTPCTVDDVPGRVHHVVLRRDGLPDRDLGKIDFADTRQVVIRQAAGDRSHAIPLPIESDSFNAQP